jgi:uncharacterized coiled-coil protein SlyX
MTDSGAEEPAALVTSQDAISQLCVHIEQQEKHLSRTAQELRQLREELQDLQQRLDAHHRRDQRHWPLSVVEEYGRTA